jgi:tRNA uridine 5-carbamoylmethylation protein Kti12
MQVYGLWCGASIRYTVCVVYITRKQHLTTKTSRGTKNESIPFRILKQLMDTFD